MDTERLLQLKREIASYKEQAIRGEQTQELLMKELKEMGYENQEEAQKALRTLSKECEDLVAEQEQLLIQLEELHDGFSS